MARGPTVENRHFCLIHWLSNSARHLLIVTTARRNVCLLSDNNPFRKHCADVNQYII